MLSFILGLLAGAVGFLPFVAELKAQRNVTETSNLSYTSIMVLSIVGSSAVLFASVGACIVFNRENILPFVGGEAAGLITFALAFGIWQVFFKHKGKG